MKKRRQVFALFKSNFFRKDLLVTLGDFALKMQNWEGKYVNVTCLQKNLQIRTLIKQLLAKCRFLKKLQQISHFHQKKNVIF